MEEQEDVKPINVVDRTKAHTCKGCQNPIKDQYILHLSANSEWHSKCLVCASCNNHLGNLEKCFLKNEEPYCKNDYHRLFPRHCMVCRQQYNEKDYIIKAKSLIFHARCFRCDVCDSVLTLGDPFVVKSNRVVCAKHGLAKLPAKNYNMMENNVDNQLIYGDKNTLMSRVRTVLSDKQVSILEAYYAVNPKPGTSMKRKLVELTGLSERVIRVWFQNKRCKDKKKPISYFDPAASGLSPGVKQHPTRISQNNSTNNVLSPLFNHPNLRNTQKTHAASLLQQSSATFQPSLLTREAVKPPLFQDGRRPNDDINYAYPKPYYTPLTRQKSVSNIHQDAIPWSINDLVIPPKEYVIPPKDCVIPPKDYVIPSEDYVIPPQEYIIPSKQCVFPLKDNVIRSKGYTIPTKDHESNFNQNVVATANRTEPINDDKKRKELGLYYQIVNSIPKAPVVSTIPIAQSPTMESPTMESMELFPKQSDMRLYQKFRKSSQYFFTNY